MQVHVTDVPIGLDLGGDYGRLDSMPYVLVGLTDDDGIQGVGWTFGYTQAEADSIVEELREGPIVGPAAQSALDLAQWDLRGKREGQPVHRLLGGTRTELPTYASTRLWQSLTPEELAANAAAFVAEGFGAVKIRTGGSTEPAAEADRAAAVRSAVGPDVRIMYDALQQYTPEEAIAVGRALEHHDVAWLEDPVAEDDLAGCAEVARALDVPVASGEDTAFPSGLVGLLDARAVDILMVDPKWVGGITPWLEVAHEAARRGVPIVSHISPELAAPALSASPTAMILEWFDWSFPLYETPPRVVGGVYRLPDEPGLGLDYRPDLLDRLFG